MTTDPAQASAEVRIIRRKFGLSIPDLAQILNVDSRTINRWEGGQSCPPPGVLEALRALDTRMQHRLIERIAQLKTQGATTITYYRDRDELTKSESFYLHLPSSLYEWEVAQLVDRLNLTAIYTQAWRERHPYRAPNEAGTSALNITTTGTFELDTTDTRVHPALRAALPTVLPALGANDPQRTLAFAPRVPLAQLLDTCDQLRAEGKAPVIIQPWDDAPTTTQILTRRNDPHVTIDIYLVDTPGPLTIEIAGIHDTHHSDTWADTPTDRAAWL